VQQIVQQLEWIQVETGVSRPRVCPDLNTKCTSADPSARAFGSLLTARFTVRIRAPEPKSDLDPPSKPLHYPPLVHEMCTERRDFYRVAMTGSK
jgi:hypothetical protein